MQQFNPTTNGYLITPLENTNDHLKSVAFDLGALGYDKSYADVTIHCKDKSTFKVIL